MGRAVPQGVRVGSRGAKRYSAFGCADAIYNGGPLRVRIHNVALSGICIETQRTVVQPGDWLRVALPIVGTCLGQVAWTKDQIAGLQLAEALTLDDLTAIFDELRECVEAATSLG